MSNRIMMLGIQLAILAVISCSRASHLTRPIRKPTKTHIADAISSDTCVAPSKASVPNTDTQVAISAISATKGIRATNIDKCIIHNA